MQCILKVPYVDLAAQHAPIKNELLSAVSQVLDSGHFILGDEVRKFEEQFAELAEFVQEQRFERLGVFTYSLEADTPAARLPDHVSEEISRDRRDRLMALQQEIAFAWNQEQIGRQIDVLIDVAVPEETSSNGTPGKQPAAWVGRTFADAPDVDPVVYVTGDHLEAGQIVPCEIVATKDYDLIAVPISPGAGEGA